MVNFNREKPLEKLLMGQEPVNAQKTNRGHVYGLFGGFVVLLHSQTVSTLIIFVWFYSIRLLFAGLFLPTCSSRITHCTQFNQTHKSQNEKLTKQIVCFSQRLITIIFGFSICILSKFSFDFFLLLDMHSKRKPRIDVQS